MPSGGMEHGTSGFVKRVDQAFYDQVKKQNGGTLPANLVDSRGNPRKLTNGPADRAYREEWKAVAARVRNSKAVVGKGVKVACVPCAAKAGGVTIPAIILPGKGGVRMKAGSGPAGKIPVQIKTPQQQAEPCRAETLVVACSHEGERKFTLELPPGKSDGSPPVTEFEVIDDGGETITCTTRILSGPCTTIHKGKVFDVYPCDSVETRTDSRLVFRAAHDPSAQLASFADLFSSCGAWSPHTFTIRTQSCQQTQPLTATVLVYPQIQWDVDISLSAATSEESLELDFNGKVAVTVTGRKREFGGEIKSDLNRALNIVALVFKITKFLTRLGAELGGVEISFDLPQLRFKGSWGRKEIGTSPKCGFVSDWSLAFAPLVRVTLRLDIVEFLVKKFPAIGQAIERLREAVRKEADVEIFFEAKGTIDGKFAYRKAGFQAGEADGHLGGELEMTLEGHASGDFKVLFVHAGAEGKLGGRATFLSDISAGSDEKGAYAQGCLSFEGLTLYAMVAVDGGLTFTWPPEFEDPPSVSQTSGDETVEASMKQGLSGSIVYQHDWQVLSPATLLGSEEHHYFLLADEGN